MSESVPGDGGATNEWITAALRQCEINSYQHLNLFDRAAIEMALRELQSRRSAAPADREAVIEECARVADEHAALCKVKSREVSSAYRNGGYDGGLVVAATIRALKSPPTAAKE